MIRASKELAIGALVLSGGLHMGGVFALYREPPAKVQGGAQASVAMLGNSFRDVTKGEMGEAPPDEDVVEDVQPEPLTQTQPLTTPQTPVETMQTLAPPAMTAPVKPLPQSAEPGLAIQPAPLTTLEPVPTQPTVMAALPEQDNPVLSSRPKTRPKSVEQEAAKRPDPKPAPKAKPKKQKATQEPKAKKKPASQGSKVKKREEQGAADGNNAAQANSGGKKTRKRKASNVGNASASNYPGLVLRKIKRQRRPKASRKARTTVSFKISASGGLSSARVARSSGDAKFDGAALNIIRRAAPFPKPPSGAKRSFSITIDSR